MHVTFHAVSNSHGQYSRAQATGTYLDPPVQLAEYLLHLRSTAEDQDSLPVESQAGRTAVGMGRTAAAAVAAGVAA